MANPNRPSKFEQMILNHGPIQESIIQNLTRWDFRNLLLAGVRTPVNQEFQRKHQLPTRCNEEDPEIPGEQCPHSTATGDEIRACSGRPMWVTKDKKVYVTKWIGHQPWLNHRGQHSNSDDGQNTIQHPIHFKVCKRCHESCAAVNRAKSLLTIARFRTPLCKMHSREQSKQSPPDACRCLDFIFGNWDSKPKCSKCQSITQFYLFARSAINRKNSSAPKFPWSSPIFAQWKNLLWPDSKKPVCPIEGCTRRPWLDESRHERMQMCLGCNAIFSIEASPTSPP